MVDQSAQIILAIVYSILFVGIAGIIFYINNKKTKTVESTPNKQSHDATPDTPHPNNIPHPTPTLPPVAPSHHYAPHVLPPNAPSNSYFNTYKTFKNNPQTDCLKKLAAEITRLAHPIEVKVADKGVVIHPTVANDKKVIGDAWRSICNAVNNGIKTCPDMQMRYILPQGAGEQIEFVNNNGLIKIPDNSKFHCEDKRLPTIYFRLNHQGSRVTLAMNVPNFS